MDLDGMIRRLSNGGLTLKRGDGDSPAQSIKSARRTRNDSFCPSRSPARSRAAVEMKGCACAARCPGFVEMARPQSLSELVG